MGKRIGKGGSTIVEKVHEPRGCSHRNTSPLRLQEGHGFLEFYMLCKLAHHQRQGVPGVPSPRALTSFATALSLVWYFLTALVTSSAPAPNPLPT